MNKFIGNKKFYRTMLFLAVPIMIQNAITNFVGFLDNIMVGQLGTEQMSGVAIVNQFIFVFNLCVFGGFSGAGIFGAQFYGRGDIKGVRNTFRFKIITGIIVVLLTGATLIFFGDNLIRFYLSSEGSTNGALTLQYGKEYLMVVLLEIIPFTLVQAYASTLRETGQTFVPMLAGIVAVVTNLVFNYLFIFGKLGFPELGVAGAALATVIARIVELLIVMVWTHANSLKNEFIIGAYRTLRIPGDLALRILKKGSPLLANEVLWSAGIAFVNQCFSVRGLSVVASVNIQATIGNLFNVIFLALGNTVAIMVGQQLGANKFKEARDTANKVIAFAVGITVVTGGLMIATASLFPRLYNTSDDIRQMAAAMIIIAACFTPIQAFLHCSYFTIRSGGRTIITFLFDSFYTWVVALPFVYCLVHFTNLPILLVFGLYSSLDIIKSIVGFILLHKGIWVRNIVNE